MDPRESAFIRVPFATAENPITPRDASIPWSGTTETAARGTAVDSSSAGIRGYFFFAFFADLSSYLRRVIA